MFSGLLLILTIIALVVAKKAMTRADRAVEEVGRLRDQLMRSAMAGAWGAGAPPAGEAASAFHTLRASASSAARSRPTSSCAAAAKFLA